MIKTEENIMETGKYRKITSFLLIFGMLFSVQCQSLKTDNENKPILRNFFPVESNRIAVIIDQWPLGINDIEIDQKSVFALKSLKKYSKNQSQLLLEKLDNSKDSKFFSITYKDEMKNLHNINVFFYSQIINLDKLNRQKLIKYNRERDIAPPIITMSSLQVGNFIVCNENGIQNRFESALDFYLLFSSIEKGTYKVSEIDCSNSIFVINVN